MNSLRFPPQALESEQALVGSILFDAEILDDLPPGFRPEHLYRDSSREIVRAVIDLRSLGHKPIDTTMVENHLRRIGMLDRIGGADTIFDLLDHSVQAPSAPYHASVVHQAAMLREIIRVAGNALESCYAHDADPDQVIEKASAEFFAVSLAGSSDGVTSFRDALAATMAMFERRREGEVEGLSTGLRDLDAMIDGLVPRRLIVLAARPAQGKTSLGLNIAERVAQSGIPVYFVSQEMGSRELVERVLSGRSGVDTYRIRNAAYMGDRDLLRIRAAAENLQTLPMPIDDTPGRTIGQIAASARRLKSKQNIGLVVVDYIQLLEDDGNPRSSRQEQVSRISRRLKGLAREIDAPVLALSQLNRLVEGRSDKRPILSDLRESGAIEQDADQVLFIHRPEYYDPNDQPGVAELLISKNRHGATGMVKLQFDGRTTTFRPLSDAQPIDDTTEF